MSDCRCCANVDTCQYIVAPDDCEETFEHHDKAHDLLQIMLYRAGRGTWHEDWALRSRTAEERKQVSE